MRTTLPMVSVVIATYNSLERLQLCLRGLENQSLNRDRFEVIVVVDGSRDGTVEYLHEYEGSIALHYINRTNGGQASARNTGIRAARGRTIVLIDDDCYCDSAFLKVHAEYHESYPDAVLFGNIQHIPAEYYTAAREAIVNGETELLFGLSRVDLYFNLRDTIWDKNLDHVKWICFTGPNVSVPRDHLIACGLFDEEFRGWGLEDCELGYRLHKQGVRIDYAPKARNFHLDKSRPVFQLHSELARNLKYWKRKYKGNREIASYISFICRGISLQQLNAVCSPESADGTKDEDGKSLYFSPFAFFGDKETAKTD